MIDQLRVVKTTGPPALITVGACADMISVPRLTSRAEMPMTAISSAANSPTTTILRWVVRSAVYIDQFMASPQVIGCMSARPRKRFKWLRWTNPATDEGFPLPALRFDQSGVNSAAEGRKMAGNGPQSG